MSFKSIPLIYAGNLPDDVENELRAWQDELCFHGDGGCVFSIRDYDLEELPLFKAWMISIGAWTEEITNLGSFSTFRESFPDGTYPEYQAWLGTRLDILTVAMTGT